jgi:DNA-binding GntR family transcriptional regulator
MIAAAPELERDRAYRLLVDLILAGEWRPDQSLSERKLSDAIQMGRMPVREALQQLERERLIDIKPARGTVVRPLNVDDLREVYQVREVLECLATRLAAQRSLTPELRDRRVQMQAMAAAPHAYSAAEIDDAGTALHDAIYAAAGNRALTETFQPLRMRARLAFGLPRFFNGHEAVGGLAEHLEILAAIEAREPDRAAELMRQHLRRGLELRIRLYETRLKHDAGAKAGAARNGHAARHTSSGEPE